MYKDKPLLHEREKQHVPGKLRTISLDVTPSCNMKCAHCYAETFVNVKPVELSILKKAIDELYELGVCHYVLQGGEPIVDSPRLEAIIKMIRPDETYITVVSNGWAMTPEKIRWLKKLKVDKICYSLDSGIEKEHDVNRGPGSFKKVIEAIDHTIAEGLDISISTVVTHESLYAEGFKRSFEIAKEKKIRVDVQIAEPVGKWDGRKDLLITPEDALYIERLRETAPLTSKGFGMVKRDIYCQDGNRCPAGTDFMAISSDGEFLPCNFMQISLGNIREKSVKKMREDLLKNKWFYGVYPHCILGENDEFIDSFVVAHIDKPKPLDAYEVFALDKVEN